MRIQIKQSVDTALKALTKQQRDVLVLRYCLGGGKKRTLQEIADEFSLTRERIRQIQNSALERMREDACMRELSRAMTHIEKALDSCGGAASEDDVCRACEIATKSEKNYVRLLLEVGERFTISPKTDSVEQYWYTDTERKHAVDTALKRLHQEFSENSPESVLDDKRFQDLFVAVVGPREQRFPSGAAVAGLSRKIGANARGEWGLKSHPEISLSSLAGYISVVLREAGRPLHFSDIARKVFAMRGGECHEGSCHNELVRRKEFVLVGRGLYALESMGYRPGTISDIIVEGMKENGPMTREQVVEFVSKHRHVKEQSIVLALNKKDAFSKSDDGRYFYVR